MRKISLHLILFAVIFVVFSDQSWAFGGRSGGGNRGGQGISQEERRQFLQNNRNAPGQDQDHDENGDDHVENDDDQDKHKHWDKVHLNKSNPDHDPAVVPEPASLTLLGAGLAGAALLRRRKR